MVATPPVFPEGDWEVEPPAEHGLDAAALDRAAGAIAGVEERYGFLVVKNGVIVHETYYQGDATSQHKIYSLTKGFGAALTGIAATEGWLSVQDRVTDWLPYHTPDIAEGATVEHILSMTAAHDPVGETYEYTSGPVLNTLPNILWEAAGMSPRDFYQQCLAEPLGLTLHWPSTDRGWMQIGNRGPMPVLTATHRDIARLGWFWLNRGRWGDRQLIDEQFIAASLTPPFPAANNAYGYLWWLNTPGGAWKTAGNQTGDGAWFPGAPDDLFVGIGARGKLLYVLPSENMVVVSMGETAAGGVHAVWSSIKEMLEA
jgi:CubicO group peptidase (beta-lactamase class C family)